MREPASASAPEAAGREETGQDSRAAEILFFRHGQSAANAGEKTSDPASIPLTPAGQEQALALRRFFFDPPQLAVSSPFLRARHSASLALGAWPGLEIAVWPVQEFTYLAPERCRGTTAAERAAWVREYWERGDPLHCDGPGAESFAAFWARVRAAHDRLLACAETHARIVVFGHMQFMLAFRSLVEDGAEMPLDARMLRVCKACRDAPIANGGGFLCAALATRAEEVGAGRRLFLRFAGLATPLQRLRQRTSGKR